MITAPPKQEKGNIPPQGNDNQHPRLSLPLPRSRGLLLRHQAEHPAFMTTDSENGGPSGTYPQSSDEKPTIPPRNHKRGHSNHPPDDRSDSDKELAPVSDAPGPPIQPSIRMLHDKWDLDMDLMGQGGDENPCIVLRVSTQLVRQLSQQLGEMVKNLRAGQEAESETNKNVRLPIRAKNPEVLAAIISVVHGADPRWSICCFEDFMSLAVTCWEFGCCTDGLGGLLRGRPTWPPDDSDEDQVRTEQWVFAALVFKIPEIFEQATQRMVMNMEGASEGSEIVEFLPVKLREEIKRKGHEITEEIMGFVRAHMSECFDQQDTASDRAAWVFTTAMHNSLKSVGYNLLIGAIEQGKSPGAVAHLLKALENLPLQPPVTNTTEVDPCVPNQMPDSPSAASHSSGSSNSSGSRNLTCHIPPRRARASLVITNAAVDLWEKRVAFADKIHHFLSRDSARKGCLKGTDEEKYVSLVKSFREKLQEAKPNWNCKGFDLTEFLAPTDSPHPSPGVGSVEENGTH